MVVCYVLVIVGEYGVECCFGYGFDDWDGLCGEFFGYYYIEVCGNFFYDFGQLFVGFFWGQFDYYWGVVYGVVG